jgi:hypothetical protein
MIMSSKFQTTLNKLFSLSLTDRLYVVERVLSSVREEYQQELDKAVNDILYKEMDKKIMKQKNSL